MAVLTTKERNGLAGKEFAGPDRSYPIPDENHARNALARVAQHGTPSEMAAVRAKVHAKFPHILQEHMKEHGESIHDFRKRVTE